MPSTKTFRVVNLMTLIMWVALSMPAAAANQFVVVVLDDSGSMDEPMGSNRRLTKMDAAKNALASVLEQVPADASVGVVAMNTRIGNSPWIVPLGPIDRQAIQSRIASVLPNGYTPLGASIGWAADELMRMRQKQIYGTYRLLIVTDGEASDAALMEQNVSQLGSRGIATDVIGVNMRSDHSLATRVQSYRRADDPQSLRRAIADVFAESTGDDNDVGESDYEMLSGLPDEAAAAALTSLTQVDNRPLGEADGQSSSADPNAPWTPTTAAPTPTSTSSSFMGMCCNLFMILLFALLAYSVIIQKGKRK